MAVQNALVQLSLRDAPTTAVLTTDLTRFTVAVGDLLLDRDPGQVAAARRSAGKLGRTIISFAAGAALGAALFKSGGLESIALPTGLAALALAIGIRAGHDPLQHRRFLRLTRSGVGTAAQVTRPLISTKSHCRDGRGRRAPDGWATAQPAIRLGM
jgi:hypothetical protein